MAHIKTAWHTHRIHAISPHHPFVHAADVNDNGLIAQKQPTFHFKWHCRKSSHFIARTDFKPNFEQKQNYIFDCVRFNWTILLMIIAQTVERTTLTHDYTIAIHKNTESRATIKDETQKRKAEMMRLRSLRIFEPVLLVAMDVAGTRTRQLMPPSPLPPPPTTSTMSNNIFHILNVRRTYKSAHKSSKNV